jgi:hypothetical protein
MGCISKLLRQDGVGFDYLYIGKPFIERTWDGL